MCYSRFCFLPEKSASLTDYRRFSAIPSKSVLTGGSGTPTIYRRFWNPYYLPAVLEKNSKIIPETYQIINKNSKILIFVYN